MNTRHLFPYLFLTTLAFMLAATAPAEDLPAPSCLEDAIADFPAARDGSEKATKRTVGRLKTLIGNGESDSRALAFLGCSTAMLSRHTLLIWKKLSFAKDGSRMMDRAAELSPDDPIVRLIRAATYLSYPARLGKEPALHEDIRFLRNALDNDAVPAGQLQETYRVFVRYYNKYKDPEACDRYLALIQNPDVKRELKDMIAGK